MHFIICTILFPLLVVVTATGQHECVNRQTYYEIRSPHARQWKSANVVGCNLSSGEQCQCFKGFEGCIRVIHNSCTHNDRTQTCQYKNCHCVCNQVPDDGEVYKGHLECDEQLPHSIKITTVENDCRPQPTPTPTPIEKCRSVKWEMKKGIWVNKLIGFPKCDRGVGSKCFCKGFTPWCYDFEPELITDTCTDTGGGKYVCKFKKCGCNCENGRHKGVMQCKKSRKIRAKIEDTCTTALTTVDTPKAECELYVRDNENLKENQCPTHESDCDCNDKCLLFPEDITSSCRKKPNEDIACAFTKCTCNCRDRKWKCDKSVNVDVRAVGCPSILATDVKTEKNDRALIIGGLVSTCIIVMLLIFGIILSRFSRKNK